MSFEIGGIKLRNNLIAAPLAGYTDVAFRRLCMECGAGLSVTEMISVKGLCYRNRQTFEMLNTSEAEYVSCVQLFGADPFDYERALSMGVLDKFDIIDVNMGCPVAKVVKNGEGSALLHKPDVAAKIVETLARSGKPVTVKMRMGFYEGEDIAVPFAKRMEQAGAAMVTVHARTAAQGYGGNADYLTVGRVRAALNIPVALSGDIVGVESFDRASGYADAFMIGRGALVNPSIFSLLGGGALSPKYPLIKRHIEYLKLYFPERYAVVTLRKFFAYYLKGACGKKEFKGLIYSLDTLNETERLVDEYLYDI